MSGFPWCLYFWPIDLVISTAFLLSCCPSHLLWASHGGHKGLLKSLSSTSPHYTGIIPSTNTCRAPTTRQAPFWAQWRFRIKSLLGAYILVKGTKASLLTESRAAMALILLHLQVAQTPSASAIMIPPEKILQQRPWWEEVPVLSLLICKPDLDQGPRGCHSPLS